MTRHVLIIRLSAIGDVAMAVPVVYSVARQYPDVRFTVLSKPFARAFFDGLASNVFFMSADIKKEYNGICGLNKLYRRLAAKNFTDIADLHDVLRSKYIRMRFFLTFVGRPNVAHINKHRKERRQLCSKQNKVFRQLPTSYDNYLKVFEQLGYPTKLNFTSLFNDGKGDLSVLPSPFNVKSKQQKWIGIAPFAAHNQKVYPLNKMEEVIRLITTNHPERQIFFFGGGKAEMEQFDKWCDKYPACVNASAALNGLTEELTLMSHLDVMLSMDSGNMHMAAITGCHVVSVWGATHPYAGFYGWRQDPDDAVQTDLPCRPCSVYGNKPCYRGDFACMNTIKPEEIVKKITKYI